jgi:hypothetical protein
MSQGYLGIPSATRRMIFLTKPTSKKEEVENMKRLIFVTVVLIVVAFAFGAIAAQQKATSPAAKAAPAADVWNVAKGRIEKIDAAAKTFDVKSVVKVKGKYVLAGKVTTIAADDNTKFFTVVKGKEKKLGFADLKTGMDVGVKYKVEAGKNIATSVRVDEK